MIGEVYVLPMLQKSKGTVVWLVGYSYQVLHHKGLPISKQTSRVEHKKPKCFNLLRMIYWFSFIIPIT